MQVIIHIFAMYGLVTLIAVLSWFARDLINRRKAKLARIAWRKKNPTTCLSLEESVKSLQGKMALYKTEMMKQHPDGISPLARTVYGDEDLRRKEACNGK